jgi:hypothetical protein
LRLKTVKPARRSSPMILFSRPMPAPQYVGWIRSSAAPETYGHVGHPHG